MKAKPASRARPRRVLVFGEDENDTKFLAELLVALCPELLGKVKAFRRPPVLLKATDSRQVPGRVARIASLVAAERTTADVLCIFAHEDCDAVEPAHESLALKIETAFAAAGCHVHAVTPAWETESWLFLWPEAVATYRRGWASLEKYRGRDVGRIVDAKEVLTRALRPPGNRGQSGTRDYRESDAPEIAKRIAELGLAATPGGKSGSYDRFRESVATCCVSLTGL